MHMLEEAQPPRRSRRGLYHVGLELFLRLCTSSRVKRSNKSQILFTQGSLLLTQSQARTMSDSEDENVMALDAMFTVSRYYYSDLKP